MADALSDRFPHGQPQTVNLITESCSVDQTSWHWPSTTNSADDSAVISPLRDMAMQAFTEF